MYCICVCVKAERNIPVLKMLIFYSDPALLCIQLYDLQYIHNMPIHRCIGVQLLVVNWSNMAQILSGNANWEIAITCKLRDN